jgi:succinate dehydrogenase flavin-adding protein (antitoxin of CptAB toxin-antitoxin module)
MMKIVTNTFNKEYSTISEEEKNELKELLSYSKKDIQNKFVELKEDVTNKLNNKLEESEDLEIKEKISQTISKINESQPELITLYKLKQLSEGL